MIDFNPFGEKSVFDKSVNEIYSRLKKASDPDHDRNSEKVPYPQYKDDPVGFFVNVLDIPRDSIWGSLEEIMLSVRDNLITAVQSATGVGKTWTAARIALWWLYTRYPAKVVTTAAPPERQIKELVWGEIHSAYRNAVSRGVIFPGDKPLTMEIIVEKEHWIKGFTIPVTGTDQEKVARLSGHHSPNLLVIVDESFAVPDSVYEAIDGFTDGVGNRELYLSNPLAPSGPFYNLVTYNPKCNTIRLSAFDHPNVQTGKLIIPGCVTREKTISRIENWTRPLMDHEIPDVSCAHIPSYVPVYGGTYRKITMPMFYVKTMGEFPAEAEDALISMAWIDKAISRWTSEKPEIEAIYGVDIAEKGIDANVLIERRGSWIAPMKRWKGINVIASGDVVTHSVESKLSSIFVDGNGFGAGVAPYLVKSGYKNAMGIKTQERPTLKRVKGIEDNEKIEFARLRDQLFWSMREWLKTDEAAIPPDENLKQELLALRYEQDVNGNIKITAKSELKKVLGRSPDSADALALTFYVGKQWSSLKFVQV